MENFWDYSVWGSINLIAVLLISLLAANVLKRWIRSLRRSLIPTSVLGGMMLLLVSFVFRQASGAEMFDTAFFGATGSDMLEIITYHALALGFIASAFRPGHGKLGPKRVREIFNTGVTTVSTYLLQGAFCCPSATARAPVRRSTTAASMKRITASSEAKASVSPLPPSAF